MVHFPDSDHQTSKNRRYHSVASTMFESATSRRPECVGVKSTTHEPGSGASPIYLTGVGMDRPYSASETSDLDKRSTTKSPALAQKWRSFNPELTENVGLVIVNPDQDLKAGPGPKCSAAPRVTNRGLGGPTSRTVISLMINSSRLASVSTGSFYGTLALSNANPKRLSQSCKHSSICPFWRTCNAGTSIIHRWKLLRTNLLTPVTILPPRQQMLLAAVILSAQ